MDYTPFLTNPESNPDFLAIDHHCAFLEMRARNKAIQQCVDGEMSAEDLLDYLEMMGLSPVQYVDAVEGAVEALIV